MILSFSPPHECFILMCECSLIYSFSSICIANVVYDIFCYVTANTVLFPPCSPLSHMQARNERQKSRIQIISFAPLQGLQSRVSGQYDERSTSHNLHRCSRCFKDQTRTAEGQQHLDSPRAPIEQDTEEVICHVSFSIKYISYAFIQSPTRSVAHIGRISQLYLGTHILSTK